MGSPNRRTNLPRARPSYHPVTVRDLDKMMAP